MNFPGCVRCVGEIKLDGTADGVMGGDVANDTGVAVDIFQRWFSRAVWLGETMAIIVQLHDFLCCLSISRCGKF